MNIMHDAAIDIAVGESRRETAWKNKSVLWSALVKKLSVTHRTAETHAAYLAAPPDRQAEVKDIGGFVGGYVAGGRRKSGAIQHRQLITLDIDHGSGPIWEDFTMIFGCAALMYSTHKHSPDKPRLRLVLPLDREVFADEYEAIARRVAGDVGIEMFDDTTYQAERLMYWPSTSVDGEFFFEFQDGPFLSADALLARYRNWRDCSEWPVSVRQQERVKHAATKQDDPTSKPGNIGAFCRVYTVADAIEKYLSDVYEPAGAEDRYTYKHGSTAGGLVLYDDKFAFSHHGTDPCSGKLCNAFDLVRIHLDGDKDEDTDPKTPTHTRPSYGAMLDLCRQDAAVRGLRVSEKLQEAEAAFSAEWAFSEPTEEATGPKSETVENEEVTPDEDDGVWREKLEIDKKGNILSTIDNIVLILENDPRLKGCIAFDEFEQRPITRRSLPWRKVRGHDARYLLDTDDDNLAHYLEKLYGVSGTKIEKALGVIFGRHTIHPVREYLDGLKWDGVPRVDTLLVKYLGVVDSPYARQTTRKALVGAVARVKSPGCKMDYTLGLIGEQGDKKSTLFDKLGGQWFSDSLTTVHGKEGMEQLQGVWIMEVAELSAFKNAEVEAVKHFIAKRKDRFRAAYGHRSQTYPRQILFFFSSNKMAFLKDATGNRRFWPHVARKDKATGDPAKMSASEIGQIWAEAVHYYEEGELLYLSDEMEAVAKEVQAEHTEQDDRTEIVAAYLERLLPEGWEDMNVWDRRQWLNGEAAEAPEGTRQRTRVTITELWTEALGLQVKDMTRFNTAPIHDIMLNLKTWERHAAKMRVGGLPSRGYIRKGLMLYSHVPYK